MIRRRRTGATIVAEIATLCVCSGLAGGLWGLKGRAQTSTVPIVFVSRQIPAPGSVYWETPRDMPGVGPWSRFRSAAPGRLLILESTGALRVLIDGSAPSSASFNLIDVNAPDVSYDGTTIVFAGLPQGSYAPDPLTDPGAWRLYTIRVDGSGLRPVTISDQRLDTSQFGPLAGPALTPYDDTDPAWLPDGRIVFSSTRWPSFAQYSGVRTSNLHVVNADGSALHRITSERNGADRPIVDPVTGKIIFSRWWRNHRFGLDDMSEIPDPRGGYIQRDGLTTDRTSHVGGPDALWRNGWHIASINPDGTELTMWAGAFRDEVSNHFYGGAFSSGGELFGNFFPMHNMSEAAGFGGIRRYQRGPGGYVSVTGITSMTLDYVNRYNPTSYGIFRGTYAGEPDVLPDGRLVLSSAPTVAQDYGLYLSNPDGTGLTRLLDLPNTTELRARAIRPRPRPPILADRVTRVASLLPPTASPSTFTQDGTFIFDALNVYGNAPVDADIVSAPPVGSAATIRFFLDHQRTSPGSFPHLDWPILIGSLPVKGDGSVRHEVPANVPSFEQLRSRAGTVPPTEDPYRLNGAAHVAGMNYGPPGTTARCIGCHAGHTMIPVPVNLADARWSNLAPGAVAAVSSTRVPNLSRLIVDRRVRKSESHRHWTSAPGQVKGQWIELTFSVPIVVRAVRLYNIPPVPADNTNLGVSSTRVTLFRDATATRVAASSTSGAVSVSGTDVLFSDVLCRVVRINLDSVSGLFEGSPAAGLAEVEVIAAGSNDLTSLPTSPEGVRIVR